MRLKLRFDVTGDFQMNPTSEAGAESSAGMFRYSAVPPPVRLDGPIEGALEDAEVLLAFAAQSRRGLKAELIARLSTAGDAVRTAIGAKTPITADERAKFWLAYDELAVAMTPLSAHSIRSSMTLSARRFPASLFTSTAMLSFLAVVVFLFCIAIQSFWVAGKELLDKADQIELQRTELVKQLSLGQEAKSRAEIKYQQQRAHDGLDDIRLFDLVGKPGEKTRSPAEQAEAARLNAQRDVLKMDVDDKVLVVQKLVSELADLNARGQPLRELLQEWYRRARGFCDLSRHATQYVCPVDERDGSQELKSQREALKQAEDALDKSAPRSEPGELKNAAQGVASSLAARFHADFIERTRVRRLQDAVDAKKRELASAEANLQSRTAHEVRIILGNFATYIIPLAMGLLGSLAFILQSYTTQLREFTYLPMPASGNVVRLCLGAIAGVFGGLAGPASDAVFKGLPPLFIPFVFGYGIEILFSLLNRIVQTFTQGDAAKGRPA